MTVQHVVLFEFPEDLTAEDAAELRGQIRSWPGEIGGINLLRLGSDLTGERTKGHQYLLFMEFDDLPALKRYQQHPVHQRFAAWTREHRSATLAFDYLLTEDTVIWPSPAGHTPESDSPTDREN